ncbi:hypothetical protein [Pedobacter sp. SYSU D00535]|uniref:hypothetical protein n=1 Tax=Pedobacter sp. SYSU D00535 TaxID=2810308 RepID=UPI001A9726EC|nr:hypothetical protein [Pedobacter sp. SYSU D00535]
MKTYLINAILIIISITSSAQEKEKHYIVMESNYNYTHVNSVDTTWKQSIPYKRMVRIISEPFDFPKNFDSRWSSEAGVQFLEYLMTNYKEEFKKMRGHQSYYTGVDWIYDPKSSSSVKQYNQLSTDPKGSRAEFEIILIKGFKFTPGKYPLIKNKGTTPLHEKAILLLSKGLSD